MPLGEEWWGEVGKGEGSRGQECKVKCSIHCADLLLKSRHGAYHVNCHIYNPVLIFKFSVLS